MNIKQALAAVAVVKLKKSGHRRLTRLRYYSDAEVKSGVLPIN
jgi:hypothetical protein